MLASRAKVPVGHDDRYIDLQNIKKSRIDIDIRKYVKIKVCSAGLC